MGTPYSRGTVPLAEMTVRRGKTMFSYKLARILLTAFSLPFLATLFLAPPDWIFTMLSFCLAFLAWRHGAMKTLLDLKGLSWKDVPLTSRLFGFPGWYESAPDEYDYEQETSLAVPPRPSAQ